ncbi:hypothetical protein GC197_04450 [bacterium]|nr:hypothetical protein [bacterium]
MAIVLLTSAFLFNEQAMFGFDSRIFSLNWADHLMLAAGIAQLLLSVGVIAFVLWIQLFDVLELLASGLRLLVAKRVDADQWNNAFYVSLKPAGLLAVPGMLLWVTGVICFYYLEINFYIISYAVGIPAHLLAACLYLPLIVRWFQLWYGSSPADSDEESQRG